MEGEREIFKTEMKREKSLLSPTHTHKKKKKEQIKRAETARGREERKETVELCLGLFYDLAATAGKKKKVV